MDWERSSPAAVSELAGLAETSIGGCRKEAGLVGPSNVGGV